MFKNCVYCGSTTDLNTQITISINDSKINVSICDVHAEDATIKTAREAYVIKQKEIDEVIAKAKALGLDLSQTKSGLSLIEQSAPDSNAPKSSSQPADKALAGLDINDPNVVKISNISNSMASVGGVVSGSSVESFRSLDMSSLSKKIPGATDGYAEIVTVEGREGQHIQIPRKQVSGIGVTKIVINKTTDNALQDRFKRIAKNSLEDKGGFKDGYVNAMQRNCPICNGSCIIKNGKVESACPKCGGSGFINL